MNNPIGQWASLVLLLLSACATTPTVKTETEPGHDYTRYKTFALMPLPKESPKSDPGLMSRIAEPAHAAVVEALGAKGLKEADMATADLAVHLHGQSVPKVHTTDWGYKSGPNYNRRQVMSAERDIEVEHYDERTLTIDLFDNKTKQQVWSGARTANSSERIDAGRLQEAIRTILASYPGGSGGTKP